MAGSLETNNKAKISSSVKKNVDAFERLFSENSDLKQRLFKIGNADAAILYVDGGVDPDEQSKIMASILQCEAAGSLKELTERILPICCVKTVTEMDACREAVLRGDTVLFCQKQKGALLIGTSKWQCRAIAEPPMSSVLRGPREGFTENLRCNLTQIRRRIQTPALRFEHLFVGRLTHTDVAVIWIDGVADPKVLHKIQERIGEIDCDGILDVNYLVEHLEERPQSLFQQSGNHEKPDEVAAKILEGRVAVMVNGSPIALTLPFVLFENYQQSEDYYTRSGTASFLRIIRVVGVLIGIFLPALYVSAQVYHAQVIPLSYLYTLLNAIQGLPMTPLMEMVFVLVIFEILHEASFRMPRYVGMAMSVVGALVLGDTAVKAGLISSPSIMIVALSTIAMYAVPDLVGVNKIMRLAFAVIAGFAGLWGIALGACCTLLYLASLDSYGAPYLAPYAPNINCDRKDGIVRSPLREMLKRPQSFAQVNKTRKIR